MQELLLHGWPFPHKWKVLLGVVVEDKSGVLGVLQEPLLLSAQGLYFPRNFQASSLSLHP